MPDEPIQPSAIVFDPWGRWWLRMGVPTVVWMGLLSLILMPANFHIGYDVYFHTQLSEMMAEHGIFLREFPWAVESMWADAWFDKEWLFHVLMIPFLQLGRDLGPKLYTLVLNLGVLLSFAYLLRGAGVGSRGLRFWLALMPFASAGIFIVRMATCRPHLMSLIILAMALGAMLRRNWWLLALFSGLYAISYTGYWQLLGLVLLFDICYLLLSDSGRRRGTFLKAMPMLLPAFGGMAIGTLIHPNFPNNVYGLYVQNVVVLMDAWTQEINPYFRRPDEFKGAGLEFFRLCLPIFLIGGLGVLVGIRRRLRYNRNVILFALYFLGYLLMFYKSVRFIEYFQPFAICFLAIFLKANPLPRLLPKQRLHKWAAAGIVCGTLAFCWYGYQPRIGLRYYYWLVVVRANEKQEGGHRYAKAGQWLRENLQPGEIVFSTQWDDNSILWYHAPDLKYQVFLDPMFMIQRDRERYKLFSLVLSGQHPNPANAIMNDFNSRVVYLSPEQNELAMQLERLGFKHVFEGKTRERIYLLSDKPVYLERSPLKH